MHVVKADKKVRVCISKSTVKKYGDTFILLRSAREIILLPVPKDPIKEMRVLGQKAGVYKFSLEKLRKLIREETLKEAVRT